MRALIRQKRGDILRGQIGFHRINRHMRRRQCQQFPPRDLAGGGHAHDQNHHPVQQEHPRPRLVLDHRAGLYHEITKHMAQQQGDKGLNHRKNFPNAKVRR